MASPKLIAAGVVVVIAAVVGSMCVFTVRQDQQALVLQFGNPVHAVSEPGLHFKLPIQNVEYYERRILELDPPVQQVLLSDLENHRSADLPSACDQLDELCSVVWSASEFGDPW